MYFLFQNQSGALKTSIRTIKKLLVLKSYANNTELPSLHKKGLQNIKLIKDSRLADFNTVVQTAALKWKC